MCCVINADLYQLVHPWHWLTYGQNATAVSALFAGIATIAAIAAGIFAAKAYWATMSQLANAREQTRIARQQYLNTVTPHLAPEALGFDGLQDSMFHGESSNIVILVTLKNYGTGRAINVIGKVADIAETAVSIAMLQPEMTTKVEFSLHRTKDFDIEKKSLIFTYFSEDGREFQSRIHFADGGNHIKNDVTEVTETSKAFNPNC